MIFAQLSVTLTAVKKVSAEEEQMAACTLHCVSFSIFECGVLSRIDFFCFVSQNRPAGHLHPFISVCASPQHPCSGPPQVCLGSLNECFDQNYPVNPYLK